MGYVTEDATEFSFSDNLNEMLEFANGGNVQMFAMGADNNHATTVAKAGEKVTLPEEAVKVSGQSMSVELSGDAAKALRGQWVKVTFDAQIKAAKYADVAALVKARAEGANWAQLKADENGNVQIEKAHDGVPNKASFSVTTENGGKFTKDTNTVTIEPQTTKVTAEKQWKNADGTTTWPAEVEEVVINVLNGTQVVSTITLTADKPSAESASLLGGYAKVRMALGVSQGQPTCPSSWRLSRQLSSSRAHGFPCSPCRW